MKLKTTSLTVLSVISLAAAAYGAATVTYSTYTASSSTDTSWISVPGSTEIAAFNVGGGATTYGGLTWLDTVGGGGVYNETTTIDFYYHQPNVAWGSTASVFYSGGPALLNTGGWWANTNAIIDLRGFTVGQEYLVQFVFADTRQDGVTLSLQGASGVTGSSSATTYSYTDGRYLVVNAQFTADTANTTWIPGIAGNTGEQIGAIRIVAIPEPSAALLGGLGLLALLRRRR